MHDFRHLPGGMNLMFNREFTVVKTLRYDPGDAVAIDRLVGLVRDARP
jgi:hypothetical protein